ncbi:Small VCP/p97-interacting protein [Apodemus speciosus]|uniref:Small VCP/p97-interacting protein n=1 Tax=Apodemus speciosus TaxID=105296 RepID=A0ABQ0EYL7_APOSI
MGLCFPCPAESAPPSPSPEEKRQKLAEAAERRQKEAASRGILDIQSVEAKKKKKEHLEKQMETSGPPTAGGLRGGVCQVNAETLRGQRASRSPAAGVTGGGGPPGVRAED